jgi:hypothetical protein
MHRGEREHTEDARGVIHTRLRLVVLADENAPVLVVVRVDRRDTP